MKENHQIRIQNLNHQPLTCVTSLINIFRRRKGHSTTHPYLNLLIEHIVENAPLAQIHHLSQETNWERCSSTQTPHEPKFQNKQKWDQQFLSFFDITNTAFLPTIFRCAVCQPSSFLFSKKKKKLFFFLSCNYILFNIYRTHALLVFLYSGFQFPEPKTHL